MQRDLVDPYANVKQLLIVRKKVRPKVGVAFDTYWRGAAERQNIFFKRFNGERAPWTNDEILNLYKFTNVYRANRQSKPVSNKNVIYKGSQKSEEVFFRLLLFKIFNRISTWELLESKLGKIRLEDYSFRRYDKVLSSSIEL